MEVSAKTGEGKAATIDYNFGATLEESVKLFGAEAVHSCFVSDAKVTVQAAIRRLINADKKPEEITEYFKTYKIGVKAMPVSVDPIQKLLSSFGSMSPEEQAELLNKLRQKAQEKKG